MKVLALLVVTTARPIIEQQCSMSTLNLGTDPRELYNEIPAMADVYRCGNPQKLIVAVTGAALNTQRENYTMFARSLARDGYVVAVLDRFGAAVNYNLATPLSIERAIEAVGATEVYLFGHSLGAQVVLATLQGTCGDFCSEPANVSVEATGIGYGVSPPAEGISNNGKPFLAMDGALDSLDQDSTFQLSTIPSLTSGAVAVEAVNLEHMSPCDGPYTRVGDLSSSAPWPLQVQRIVSISSAFFSSSRRSSEDICDRLDKADPFGSFSFCIVL